MAKDIKRRLGKGLSSLMAEPVAVSLPPEAMGSSTNRDIGKRQANNNNFQYIALDDITPNRYQPRISFDEEALDALAASIRSDGVMQPLLVRRSGDARGGGDGVGGRMKWELVVGERRLRASRLAGLAEVPCIVASLEEQQAAEWAVVENLQREDLNPLELAAAFGQLQRHFGMTQDQIAMRVGIHRASVANHLRLLELEEPIQRMVQEGTISFGHAKLLLSMPAGHHRLELARVVVKTGISVRALERMAAGPEARDSAGGGRGAEASAAVTDLEQKLGEHLGTRVRIRTRAGGKKGALEIEFYDLDHFESLLQKVGFRR